MRILYINILVIDVDGLMFQTKISRFLGDEPNLGFAGSNVNLTITTESLTLMIMESGEVRIWKHLAVETLSMATYVHVPMCLILCTEIRYHKRIMNITYNFSDFFMNPTRLENTALHLFKRSTRTAHTWSNVC